MRSAAVLSYRGVFVREIYWYLEKYFATLVVVFIVVIVAVIVVAAAAVIVCVETFQFYLGFGKLMLYLWEFIT
jgi:hypothetical protein